MISFSPFIDYHFSLFSYFSCKHFLFTSDIVNFINFHSIPSLEAAELADQYFGGLILSGSQALTPWFAHSAHLSWKGERVKRPGMRKLVDRDKDGEITYQLLCWAKQS